MRPWIAAAITVAAVMSLGYVVSPATASTVFGLRVRGCRRDSSAQFQDQFVRSVGVVRALASRNRISRADRRDPLRERVQVMANAAVPT